MKSSKMSKGRNASKKVGNHWSKVKRRQVLLQRHFFPHKLLLPTAPCKTKQGIEHIAFKLNRFTIFL